MRAVDKFIEKLRNIKYDYKSYPFEEYNCELAEISKMVQKGEFGDEKFLAKLKSIYESPFFELHHPTHNHIKTRAVKSITYPERNMLHYTFFIDKDNEHPWFLMSSFDLCGAIITLDEYFLHTRFMSNRDHDVWIRWFLQSQLSSLDIRAEQLLFRDAKFVINLALPRPHHYFADNLFWIRKLNLNLKKVPVWGVVKPFFEFKDDKFNLKTGDDLVLVPCCIVSYSFTHGKIPDEHSAFEELVKQEALRDLDAIVSEEHLEDKTTYELKIWLGIPGERRKWLQSNNGIALILKNLTPYFSSIKVFVDGMTAYDGERIEIENNLESFEQISYEVCQALEGELKAEDKRTFIINSEKTSIKLKSLSGYDYRSKICYCHLCDIVISETSTTALVPFHFCRKPGVIFYPALPHHKNYAENFAKEIPNLYALEEEYFFKDGCVADYNICPEHLYNLTAQSLEGLAKEGKLHAFKNKELKMHRLKVPKVKLYAKKTELEEKYNINISLETASLNLEFEEKLNSFLQAQNATKIIATGAVLRVRNHLAYKLGQSMIKNSKSILGSILMPYILIGIAISHKRRKNKAKLPPLQNYGDYQQALKEKESFTYKLGLAFIKANKTLLIGGYFKFFFKELPKLRAELEQRRNKSRANLQSQTHTQS